MRRIAMAFMTTVSSVVLLFSYHTSRNEAAVAAPDPASPGSAATGSAATGSATTGSATTGSATGGGTSAQSSKTYTGDAVDTRWGPVQVEIAVSNGQIVSADVVQVPWENDHDIQINTYAVPILNSEVVAAQSANIDSVSGATVTSGGYQQSVQSAIDQAGL